jgi:hypothetical protein
VSGHSRTASLAVKMDPRVTTSLAGLEQQFNLQIRLASMMTRNSQAVLQARSVRKQLRRLSAQASSSTSESIKPIEKKVSAVLGTPDSVGTESTLERLNNDVITLYGYADRPDSAPSPAIVEATNKIERELSAVIKQWEGLETTDLPDLNRQLRDANLPEVGVETTLKEEAD